MNEHETQITRADVESVVAKLETFVEGLPPGERAAVGGVLTALCPEHPANDSVQGYFGFIDGGFRILRGLHTLIYGVPGPAASGAATPATPASSGQQRGIGRLYEQ